MKQNRNAIRISLTERDGEIRGVIESHGDKLFYLESLALIVETFAEDVNLSPAVVLDDVRRLVCPR